MEKIAVDLFTRLGETVASSLSPLLRRKVSVSTPTVNKLNTADISKQIATEGGVCVASVSFPFSSVIVLYLPSELARFLPELIINSKAKEAPAAFTDLHSSALTEIMNSVWNAAASAIGASLNLPFKISAASVFWSTIADTMERVSVLKEAQEFYCSFYKIVFPGSRGVLMVAVVPVSFVEQLIKKAVKPPPSPVKKKVPLESFKVEHVPAAAAAEEHPKPKEKEVRFSRNLEVILDIPMEIVVELGHRDMKIGQVLEIAPGSVVELWREVDTPVDIKISGIVIAKGEVVSVGENFGVRISKLVTPTERLEEV
ncbi:MAG: FliM/FliN family flagellar motor switch protein [bacterium]